MTIKLNDNVSIEDKSDLIDAKSHNKSLWNKTKISAGYGLTKNEFGHSALDEVIFEEENLVPLTGTQYAMEMIFGVKGPLTLPTLNDSDGIGAQGSTILPSVGLPYAYGQSVCLFGIGIGGAAENNITALEVKYSDTNVSEIIPFRYTADALSAADAAKYFGKKAISGKTGYFLKKFDSPATIKHLYKDKEDLSDGTALDNSYFTTPSEYDVESFTEIVLSITKDDVKEWFAAAGNIEEARVNSIGLFTAIYDPDLADYAQIQLFSKLNIPSEPLSVAKDMYIVYRVYTT